MKDIRRIDLCVGRTAAAIGIVWVALARVRPRPAVATTGRRGAARLATTPAADRGEGLFGRGDGRPATTRPAGLDAESA